MPMRGSLGGLAIACVLLAGCPALDPAGGITTTQTPDHLLDYNEFVCHVEPVLIKRCSYLACHGNVDHAFRVYSLGKLRLPAATTRDARSNVPLSADEVERNFESASGMVYAAPASARQAPSVDQIPLLWKPLAARFGGGEHHGVAIFPAAPAKTPESDTEWTALSRWVAGAVQPQPVSADCATFFMAMGLPPRGK